MQVKFLHVVMRARYWKLLAMYVAVLDARLRTRKWPLLNMSRLVGAIVSHHLEQHADWIQQEFAHVQLENLKGKLPKFFSVDQLDAIAAASGSEIPDLLRAGGLRIDWATRSRTEARAVRNLRRRTRGDADGPSR